MYYGDSTNKLHYIGSLHTLESENEAADILTDKGSKLPQITYPYIIMKENVNNYLRRILKMKLRKI